jgi:hypothetical protein
MSVLFSSATDEWPTPPAFFAKLNRRYGFTLPCATPVNATCSEKFMALPTCGCTREMKDEVEREAASEGSSMADYTRRAVLRELRARKQEHADAA